MRTLVKRNAIGPVTTHDLAPANIAGELAPHAFNVHFEITSKTPRSPSTTACGRAWFYKSNAIELMRSVGLEV